MLATRTMLFVVCWTAVSTCLVNTIAHAQRANPRFPDKTPSPGEDRRLPDSRSILPPWVKPDSATLAAHPKVRTQQNALPAREKITLTAEQEQRMTAVREQYHPRIRTLYARLQALAQASPRAPAVAALRDSVRHLVAAQQDAIVTVYQPAQRQQYEAHQRQQVERRARTKSRPKIAPSPLPPSVRR